jgi:hypothetical protein
MRLKKTASKSDFPNPNVSLRGRFGIPSWSNPKYDFTIVFPIGENPRMQKIRQF